jgi:hypothetical protein
MELLEEFTGNLFPRGFGYPSRRNTFHDLYLPESIKEVEELIDAKDGVNCYITVYSFTDCNQKEINKESAIIDTVPFDFDNKLHPEKALRDLKKLLDWCDQFDIKPRIQYSGNKGFHAFIDFEPVYLIHAREVIKQFVFDLQDKLGLDTLDLSVDGDLNRIIRIPNTKHGSSGRYCYPFDPELLPNLTMQDIIKKSYTKSDFIPKRIPSEMMPALLHDFERKIEVKERINAAERERLKKIQSKSPLKDLHIQTKCLANEHYLKEGAKEGVRDFVMCALIFYARRQGKNRDQIEQMLRNFGDLCSPKVTEEEIQDELKKNMDRTYSYCTFFKKVYKDCIDCPRYIFYKEY